MELGSILMRFFMGIMVGSLFSMALYATAAASVHKPNLKETFWSLFRWACGGALIGFMGVLVTAAVNG